MKHFLGIEIGGTKLQLGLGLGQSGELRRLWREKIDPRSGAPRIREQIVAGYAAILEQSGLSAGEIAGAGIAFGGPVDTDQGLTVKSHQVEGWDRFPLTDWCHEQLKLPTVLQNDADTAAYAEARFGAGQKFNPVMYLTIGSGIGGGLVIDGKIYRGAGSGAMEIGHLRPGQLPRHIPTCGETVESIGSGFGITARARQAINGYEDTLAFMRTHHRSDPRATGDDPDLAAKFNPARDRFARLWDACGGNPDAITTQMIGECAKLGDRLSLELLADASEVIGWGIAQAITLINPARVVIGGGVSLLGDEMFLDPVRRACRNHVFGPFAGVAEIVPAALGEEVVIYGAVAVAAQAFHPSTTSTE